MAHRLRFHVGALVDAADRLCRAELEGFFWEGVGAGWRAAEPGASRKIFSVLGRLPLPIECFHAPEDFFLDFAARFSAEKQWLLAHGYGRMLAVTSVSMEKIMRESERLPSALVEPALRGVAFCETLLHHATLQSFLNRPDSFRDARTFQAGIVEALIFLQWCGGDTLAPFAGMSADVIEEALAEAARNKRRGYPAAFCFEEERIGAPALLKHA